MFLPSERSYISVFNTQIAFIGRNLFRLLRFSRNSKHQFLTLLEENLDLSELISYTLYNHCYASSDVKENIICIP